MSKDSLFISIDEDNWTEEYFETWPNHVFQTALSYIREKALYGKIGSDKVFLVNLNLSNDKEVHRLNLQFRGIDKPTNVLSFANADDVDFMTEMKSCKEVELGDIIIALETLQKEAVQKNILLKDHFAHLLVHGLLHLLGYDHQTDEEADQMENIEIQILQQLDISNPYEE